MAMFAASVEQALPTAASEKKRLSARRKQLRNAAALRGYLFISKVRQRPTNPPKIDGLNP
jgi:hypothetical protein